MSEKVAPLSITIEFFHKIADGIEQSHLLSPVRHAFDRSKQSTH
jgi:hypothetical protein